MYKRVFVVSIAILAIFSFMLIGCKSKTENADQSAIKTEAVPEVVTPQAQEASPAVVEPSQMAATETIPPSASPQMAPKIAPAPAAQEKMDRNKEIQTALTKAGFYSGQIDGKIGPKTKKAVENFQKAKGLKVDGKVGPKTWAELEKQLLQQ